MFPVKEIPGLKSKVKGSWKWYLGMSSDCHTHIHTPNTHTSVCTHEHTHLHTPFDDAVRILLDSPSRFVSNLGRQRLFTGRFFTPYLFLTDCSYQQQHSRYPQDTCHVPNNTDIRLRAEPKGRFRIFSLHIQASTQSVNDRVEPWTRRRWVQGLVSQLYPGLAVRYSAKPLLCWHVKMMFRCHIRIKVRSKETQERCAAWNGLKFLIALIFLKKWILCVFSNVWENVSQLEQKHLGSPVTEANLVCVLSSWNADGNFWLSLILTV